MADASRKGLFRLGGLSAIAVGISYVLGGSLPNGAEEWLRYLAGHAATWWTILALSILTDFLFLPVALALYIALKEVNRNAALVGAGLLPCSPYWTWRLPGPTFLAHQAERMLRRGGE